MSRAQEPVAIVTGAGRGIGQAIASRLIDSGRRVVIADVDPTLAASTAELLGAAMWVEADVASKPSVDSMLERVLVDAGPVDVLVNNAGWDKAGPFVDSDPADWDTVIAVNLYGVLHTCKAVLPHMIDQGRGSVINIASDAGRVGSSGEAVYSATKGGVIAFTKTIAREVARHGIRANAVCPGPTDTELFASFAGDRLKESLTKAIPLRRIASPEDVAGAVAFLASDDASYITGQTISVSGGLTMS